MYSQLDLIKLNIEGLAQDISALSTWEILQAILCLETTVSRLKLRINQRKTPGSSSSGVATVAAVESRRQSESKLISLVHAGVVRVGGGDQAVQIPQQPPKRPPLTPSQQPLPPPSHPLLPQKAIVNPVKTSEGIVEAAYASGSKSSGNIEESQVIMVDGSSSRGSAVVEDTEDGDKGLDDEDIPATSEDDILDFVEKVLLSPPGPPAATLNSEDDEELKNVDTTRSEDVNVDKEVTDGKDDEQHKKEISDIININCGEIKCIVAGKCGKVGGNHAASEGRTNTWSVVRRPEDTAVTLAEAGAEGDKDMEVENTNPGATNNVDTQQQNGNDDNSRRSTYKLDVMQIEKLKAKKRKNAEGLESS